MDIKALQFESRFSLPPNSLGYCGSDTAAGKFKKCIIEGKCEGVVEEIKKFIVLYPYLKTIAKIASLPIYSYKVFESYWLGNDLLKMFKPEDYDALLEMFLAQGVPDFFVEELRNKRPKVFIPSHLFQVLHVGVGRASGAVPFNLKSINNCMIRWGKVISLKENEALINLNSLKKSGKGYALIFKKESVPFNLKLIPGIKKGDIVAVHWEMAVKILSKDEENKLEFWTKEVLGSF